MAGGVVAGVSYGVKFLSGKRDGTPLGQLRTIVAEAGHLLPAQGPIGVFVHHNTLHALQRLPFHDAVMEASRLFGGEPYLSEAAFREALARGRILPSDVEAILEREDDLEILPGRLTRRRLRRLLLVPGMREFGAATLPWLLEEGGWLEAFREDLNPEARHALALERPAELWRACEEMAPRHEPAPPPQARRPRDAVLLATGVDLDEIVHPLLIRLCGAFLDQGLAYWPMPLREEGLLRASRRLLLAKWTVFPAGLEGLGQVLRDQERRGLGAEQVVLEMLDRLGVPPADWHGVIEATLLALPGWAGLLHKLEKQPELAPHERLPCSLTDFLALRLTLEAAAAANAVTKAAREPQAPSRGSAALAEGRGAKEARLMAVAAWFEMAQLTGIDSATLRAMSAERLDLLAQELLAFGDLERRRLFHQAYERRHERQILIPLRKHRALPPVLPPGDRLVAQVFFCIDEREESIRRHLEETDPQIETFGAAGFFGVAVDYCGLDDPHGVSLCPVVVKPGHAVVEQPVAEHAHLHERRRMRRRTWATVAWSSFISTRTLVRGWLSTATLGFLSIFPLAARVLSPLSYARLIRALNKRFLPEPRTELSFMRDDAEGRAATEGLMRGFTVEEKVERVAGVLAAAGLRRGMARLVIVLGHGSTSLNNPYESAYCCGACGGYSGGPNARLFAMMANHPAVRAGLRGKGVVIPEDTWFLGGYHDTCSDDIEFFDLDRMPEDHAGDFSRARASLDRARALSAHERARRFEAAPWGIDAEAGLRHAQERAEHLGEPRPEYGHCTNAVAFVGRRQTTRGLFMDRRAFLVSYDALQDPANEALARVLGAVIPVCGGINLEYYFSTVDNERYGSGTKLPHNISGLIGVMNGYQSDLRTGLPLQTVEIHEPVRILFVVETTPTRLMPVIHANAELAEFVENRWIRLSTLDPDDGHVEVYRGEGMWERLESDEEALPVAASSTDWYEGRREHLPLARIEPPPSGRGKAKAKRKEVAV
jgi:uncharacterized protein YbcC (UPF0753/DUF2309 family)